MIANFTLEIYDCLPGVQFIDLRDSYRAQQKGSFPKIRLKAALGPNVDEDCEISYYKIVNKKDFITIDEYAGAISVDTAEAIKEPVRVQVVIGS